MLLTLLTIKPISFVMQETTVIGKNANGITETLENHLQIVAHELGKISNGL